MSDWIPVLLGQLPVGSGLQMPTSGPQDCTPRPLRFIAAPSRPPSGQKCHCKEAELLGVGAGAVLTAWPRDSLWSPLRQPRPPPPSTLGPTGTDHSLSSEEHLKAGRRGSLCPRPLSVGGGSPSTWRPRVLTATPCHPAPAQEGVALGAERHHVSAHSPVLLLSKEEVLSA